jgi:hypothetical protein
MDTGATMTHADIVKLCDRYCRGEITADDYYAAVDRYAHEIVEAELRDMAARRKAKRTCVARGSLLGALTAALRR